MRLLDLLLPERCAICGAEGAVVCTPCHGRLPPLRPPLCERCGAPVAWPVRRCAECAGRRLGFATARAAVLYEGAAVDLVRAWKEGGRRPVASVAAGLVTAAVPEPAARAVTFVPAVSERELWRGHNAARSLARELSRLWGLPVLDCLARAAGARRQRRLPLGERRRNVADAFRARGRVPVRIVLVDDVYTTGATAAAAAAALRRGGATHVEVVTFARTPRVRGGGAGAAPGPPDGVR